MKSNPPVRRFASRAGVALLAGLILGTFAISAQDLSQLYLPREGRSRGVTSTKKLADGTPDPNSNSDNIRVKPGETHVLFDEKGAGVIQHIWMSFLKPGPHEWAPEGSAHHGEMLLRMFWNGAKEPQVEAPVGDFFALPFGQRAAVVSLPVQVTAGDGYNCFWPMPFATGGRIEIVNQGKKDISLLYYNIDWTQLTELDSGTPSFHARYRQEYPVTPGKEYIVLETEGRGHYVGTVLGVRTRSPDWFGEGDVKIWVDDDVVPSTWGTGTEDYFLSAWGLQTCSFPYFGVPISDPYVTFGGYTATYRWHIADPIVFQERLKIGLEHFGWTSPDENSEYKHHSWNEREDDFSSVAFWYQTGVAPSPEPMPNGEFRQLPQIDYILNAHDIMRVQRRGPGTIEIQPGDEWTSGVQALYRPNSEENAWMEIPFTIEKKEPLRLILGLTRSYDFGDYRVLLNGISLRDRVNSFGRSTDYRQVHFLDFWPEPGEYVLRLECVGKDPASAGYCLGIDSVRLRTRRPRVAQWAHDRDKDWKREKQLY